MKEQTTDTTKKEVQLHLEKILNSESFKSEKHQQLLRYLVDKSLQNEQPKEVTIAIEFFNEPSVNDKDTSYVRVAVYHLRKKLKEYYLTEGKDDHIIFNLEKGSYEVSFHENTKAEAGNTIHIRLIKVLTLIILLMLSALIYLYFSNVPQAKYHEVMLYEDFSSNNKPVLVVLGDLFMYHEKDGTLVRDYGINRLEDLEREHPELLPLNQSRSKYLTRQHAISTYYFSDMLKSLDRQVSFRMASELSIEDLKENNIIYIGFFKSLYLLDAYYNISHFDPSHNYSYLIEKDKKDTIQIIGNPGELHKDYGIFSRVPGIEDTFIYLIAGFTDTSVEMISSQVLKQDFLKTIGRERFPDNELPEYFEILFEVEGYDRKELSSISVVKADEIEGITTMWD